MSTLPFAHRHLEGPTRAPASSSFLCTISALCHGPWLPTSSGCTPSAPPRLMSALRPALRLRYHSESMSGASLGWRSFRRRCMRLFWSLCNELGTVLGLRVGAEKICAFSISAILCCSQKLNAATAIIPKPLLGSVYLLTGLKGWRLMVEWHTMHASKKKFVWSEIISVHTAVTGRVFG
jgi:hypothetical protein